MAVAPKTVAILSPGDMGSGVGRALAENGFNVITALDGRSARSKALADAAGMRDVGSIADVVMAADLILSILPPDQANAQARAVAAAMTTAGRRPVYADMNAISPGRARQVAAVIEAAGAPFIDGGIIGMAPGKSPAPTRFYVSGPNTAALEALASDQILVKPVGDEIGRASGLKMVYAAQTKGQMTLVSAVLMVAEALDLSAELREEWAFSQKALLERMSALVPEKALLERMSALVPRLPADAGRWIGEMEEIAATFEAAGMTADFHHGAAEIFRLMAATPFAAETRENYDTSRSLEDTVKVFVAQLKQDKNT